MRILLIDDVWTEALLLGQDLHERGHEAIVSLEPERALVELTDGVEAVVIGMEGVGPEPLRLAQRIRSHHPGVAVAFRLGVHPESAALRAAHALGPVLLGGWGAAELDHLVSCLGRIRARWAARTHRAAG